MSARSERNFCVTEQSECDESERAMKASGDKVEQQSALMQTDELRTLNTRPFEP